MLLTTRGISVDIYGQLQVGINYICSSEFSFTSDKILVESFFSRFAQTKDINIYVNIGEYRNEQDLTYDFSALQWRHNEREGVSNTRVTIVYSTVYSGADQRKYQSSASLAFVRGIHQWPVNSPHKWLVTRKMFPFDDIIMGNDPPDTLP